jgi:hypothetical protein
MNSFELQTRLKSFAYKIVSVCDVLTKNYNSYRKQTLKVGLFNTSKF